MQDMLNRWAGWAGLGMTLLASVIYGVNGVANASFWVPLALGLGLLGLYLSRNFGEVVASVTSRKARYGANSAFLVVAALAIAALALAIVNNHDFSWDLTQGKVNTLSDETVKAVSGLNQEVQVYAFFDAQQQGPFEELLRRVKALNPSKFNYEFVNPNKKPLLAQQYSVRNFGTSVLVSGDKNETINSAKEEDLVNALVKLSSQGTKSLLLITGHGEANTADTGPAGASELKKALGNANFTEKDFNLARDGAIPADTAGIIIAGPQVDYLQPEIDALRAWLGQGGRLVVAINPRSKTPNLVKLVSDAGIVLGNDIVVDPIMRLFGSDPIAPISQTFDTAHPVTKDMQGGREQLIFPLTQSVGLKDKMPDRLSGSVLATSNPTAWAFRGAGNKLPNKPGPGDQPGPIKLAAAVEGPGAAMDPKSTATKNFRIVVYGTSQVMSNNGISMYNNQDLTLNSTRWLADDEKRISIAAKKEESQPMLLERGRLVLLWWSIILLPLAVLGAGIGVQWRRRRAS
jgi:ABC-type uncharacterized transport system involved in gliding motility auxiliary subunit